MKDWVNRNCLLSGIFTAFLLPCSAEIIAAEMAIRMAEEAQYKEAHRLLAQIRKEGTVILDEHGEVLGNSIVFILDIEVPKQRVRKTVGERPKLQSLLAEAEEAEQASQKLTEEEEQAAAEKKSAKILTLLKKQKQSASDLSVMTSSDVVLEKREEIKIVSHTYFRPVRLEAVPMEFFVRYAYRPDLPMFTRLQKLLAIEQHIRNFHRDKNHFDDLDAKPVYQRDFTPATILRMRNKLLTRYMIYQLQVYSAILHRQMDTAGEAMPTEALTEEEWRRQVAGNASEVVVEQKKVAQVWGMGVEIHIRRAQYALWALQALSEMTYPLARDGSRLMPYNLAIFGITHADIAEHLNISGKELMLASVAFAQECQEGRRLITDQQFREILKPYMDNRMHFLRFAWRLDAKEIEAE